MNLFDQSGVTGGGLDPWTTCGRKDLEITIVLFTIANYITALQFTNQDKNIYWQELEKERGGSENQLVHVRADEC